MSQFFVTLLSGAYVVCDCGCAWSPLLTYYLESISLRYYCLIRGDRVQLLSLCRRPSDLIGVSESLLEHSLAFRVPCMVSELGLLGYWLWLLSLL